MRSDEEFRKEVLERCDKKLKREKAARKKTAFYLCIIAVICCAAVPAVLNNNIPAENNSADGESSGYIDNTNTTDTIDNINSGGDGYIGSGKDITDCQTEINASDNVDKGEKTEGQEGCDEMFLEPSAEICAVENKESISVPTEKIGRLFNILENAWDSYCEENFEEADKTVVYTVTFLDSSGEEKYFLSEDGFIKKDSGGYWKKLSEDKQQELENFILEINGNENSGT